MVLAVRSGSEGGRRPRRLSRDIALHVAASLTQKFARPKLSAAAARFGTHSRRSALAARTVLDAPKRTDAGRGSRGPQFLRGNRISGHPTLARWVIDKDSRTLEWEMVPRDFRYLDGRTGPMAEPLAAFLGFPLRLAHFPPSS